MDVDNIGTLSSFASYKKQKGLLTFYEEQWKLYNSQSVNDNFDQEIDILKNQQQEEKINKNQIKITLKNNQNNSQNRLSLQKSLLKSSKGKQFDQKLYTKNISNSFSFTTSNKNLKIGCIQKKLIKRKSQKQLSKNNVHKKFYFPPTKPILQKNQSLLQKKLPQFCDKASNKKIQFHYQFVKSPNKMIKIKNYQFNQGFRDKLQNISYDSLKIRQKLFLKQNKQKNLNQIKQNEVYIAQLKKQKKNYIYSFPILAQESIIYSKDKQNSIQNIKQISHHYNSSHKIKKKMIYRSNNLHSMFQKQYQLFS